MGPCRAVSGRSHVMLSHARGAGRPVPLPLQPVGRHGLVFNEPEIHPVTPRLDALFRLRLVALARVSIELAEAEVAVDDEGAG